jgi:uracil-DNA glycosylase
VKRVAFIGQAMPKVKRDKHDWPTLNSWLFQIGLQLEQIQKYFLYTALVDYFPGSKGGSHLIPTPEQIVKDRPRLINDLVRFAPDLVVTIGKLSAENCLGEKLTLLADVVGKNFSIDPFQAFGRPIKVIPLPHPSGASTWKYDKNNQKLLVQALDILKSELEV